MCKRTKQPVLDGKFLLCLCSAYVTTPKSGLSGDTETSVSFAWILCIIAPSMGIFTQRQFQGQERSPPPNFQDKISKPIWGGGGDGVGLRVSGCWIRE